MDAVARVWALSPGHVGSNSSSSTSSDGGGGSSRSCLGFRGSSGFQNVRALPSPKGKCFAGSDNSGGGGGRDGGGSDFGGGGSRGGGEQRPLAVSPPLFPVGAATAGAAAADNAAPISLLDRPPPAPGEWRWRQPQAQQPACVAGSNCGVGRHFCRCNGEHGACSAGGGGGGCEVGAALPLPPPSPPPLRDHPIAVHVAEHSQEDGASPALCAWVVSARGALLLLATPDA
jgi:hypothetical protein